MPFFRARWSFSLRHRSFPLPGIVAAFLASKVLLAEEGEGGRKAGMRMW